MSRFFVTSPGDVSRIQLQGVGHGPLAQRGSTATDRHGFLWQKSMENMGWRLPSTHLASNMRVFDHEKAG